MLRSRRVLTPTSGVQRQLDTRFRAAIIALLLFMARASAGYDDV